MVAPGFVSATSNVEEVFVNKFKISLLGLLIFISQIGFSQNGQTASLCTANPTKSQVVAAVQPEFSDKINEVLRKRGEYLSIYADYSTSQLEATAISLCRLFAGNQSTAACSQYDLYGIQTKVKYSVDTTKNVLMLDSPWADQIYFGDWIAKNVRYTMKIDTVSHKLLSVDLSDLQITRNQTMSAFVDYSGDNVNDYPYEKIGDTFLDRANKIFWMPEVPRVGTFAEAEADCAANKMKLPNDKQMSFLVRHGFYCDTWPGEAALMDRNRNAFWTTERPRFARVKPGHGPKLQKMDWICIGDI
jgi:hypothetical protein